MGGRYDVVVVGGGPAGSAAALRVRQLRPGARVLLLDRADFPRDKSCGDGIAAHGIDELTEIGVGDLVADHRPVDRLKITSPGGATVDARTRRPSFVVPRSVFDARLVAAARDRGVEVRRHKVRALDQRAGRVVLDPGTPREVEARVVVGADGAGSVVRRLVGAAATPDRHLAVAVRGYADVPAGDDHAQVITMQATGWPAYVWSFPIGDGRANVGFGMLLPTLRTAARAGEGGGGRRVLHGRLAELLPDRPARDLLAHHLPLSPGRPVAGVGRVLLAGDAASLVNPLTGEGIYYALASGRLAGEAAVSDLVGRAPDGPAAAYRRALRRLLGRHLRTTDVLTRLAQSPGFLDAAVSVAARRADVFDLLVDLGLGNGTVPPRTMLAVARARLGRARSH